MAPRQSELTALKELHPKAEVTALADGTSLVVVPDVELGPGWNSKLTTVKFVLPVAYPAANPDCFFADKELLLQNGQAPANSGLQVVNGENARWFSWHLTGWSPSRDTILTYLRFARRRLANAH